MATKRLIRSTTVLSVRREGKVVLAGDSTANASVLADLNGISLGTSHNHPSGADFAYTFQITGNEGNTQNGGTADDTPATSHPPL